MGGFATRLAARAGHRVIAMANDGDEDWVRGLGATTVIPRSAGPAAAGRLRTRVAAEVPFAEAARAHREVEAGALRGKILLVP